MRRRGALLRVFHYTNASGEAAAATFRSLGGQAQLFVRKGVVRPFRGAARQPRGEAAFVPWLGRLSLLAYLRRG